MRRALHHSLLLLAGAIAVAGCGPEETPEQRLARLRAAHEIYPVAATTVFDAAGAPTLLVDLQVANQGGEALGLLTVVVRVVGGDGVVTHSGRVTLDLEGVRPGIGARVSASVPGVALGEDDQVTVELEAGLPPEDLRQLPEYAEMPLS